MGLFYLLWFESLSKYLDVARTKAKENLFETIKLSLTE